MSKTTLLYSVHWTCKSWSKHFGEIYSVDQTLVHYTSPKYLILTIIRYETQAGKSVKVSHSKLKQLSSKGSIMDRAAKWSKEKTNSLWKFEQKLLMNFAEFYWTTRFVDLLFCQVNNYWIFEIRVEVNCPNVQPFFKL